LPLYIHGMGHFHSGKSYFTEREGLDNYLLMFTISGCGYLKYKGEEYLIEPNQAVIFYCYEHQLYRTASEDLWQFKWIHLNGAAVSEYYEVLNDEGLNIVTIRNINEINSRFDNIYDIVDTVDKKNIYSDIKICTELVNLISALIIEKYYHINDKKNYQNKREIEKVLNYIHSNYSQRINIDEITKKVFISKYHFLRLFKLHTGLSLYEYIINFRINMSKKLLKETESSVSDIAAAVGFGDTNNFIRYFKRLVGTTPGNYRRYWIN